MLEREKEKKKEREQRDQGKGAREAARALERRQKKKKAIPVQHGPASSRASPASTRQRKTRTNTRADPRKRRKKREGRENKHGRTRNRTDKNAGTRKRRQNSLHPVQNPTQITHSAPNKTTSTTNHGVRCAKPSEKTRHNQNRTPKNKAKKRRTFCSRFQDEKQKTSPKKPRTPVQSPLRKTLLQENLRQTEL